MATTTLATAPILGDATLQDFRASLSGTLVLPGDPLNGEPWTEQPPAETRFELEDNRWIPVAQA